MKNISNKENENTFQRIKVASIKDNGGNNLFNLNKLKDSRYRPWIKYLTIEMNKLSCPHAERED